MPEGPQVFRAAQRMRQILVNTTLERLTTYDHSGSRATPTNDESVSSEDDIGSLPSDDISEEDTIHSRVTRIVTKGKRAVIVLANEQGVLVTFALSGRLEYGNAAPTVTKSVVAVASFSQDNEKEQIFLTLRDPQRWAFMHLDSLGVITTTMLAQGFDPLHTVIGMREWLAECKQHPGQLVATFITNQHVVAGVGNRYRSEIMHVAKIRPDARVRDLTNDQLQILLITIYRVLKMASRGEYDLTVHGLSHSVPEGDPVARVEVSKGVLVWTTFDGVVSARRAKRAQK